MIARALAGANERPHWPASKLAGILEHLFWSWHCQAIGIKLSVTCEFCNAMNQVLQRRTSIARLSEAIKELTQHALAGMDHRALLDGVAVAVRQTLDVDCCAVLELLPDGQAFLLRAGVGWKKGYVGKATLATGRNLQEGYTLLSSQPVIVENFATETRFNTSRLQSDHGVLCGLSVVIPGKDRPFGVLGAYSVCRRAFVDDDIYFVQAISHVLGGAIERARMEEAWRTSEEQAKAHYKNTPVPTFSWRWVGEDFVLVDYNPATVDFTRGGVAELVGRRASGMYPDRPDILKSFSRCFVERVPIKSEMSYRLISTGEVKDLAVTYVFVPPDLVMVHAEDVTDRKRAEAALRQLSARLLRLQEDERRRIARELHDTTAQALAALVMNLDTLKKSASQLKGRARTALSESLALAKQSSREIRTLSYLLHPPIVDGFGLSPTLRRYVEGFKKRSGIRVDLDIPPDFPRLSLGIETALFQTIQESLTNLHHHSGTKSAKIRVLHHAGEITLEVKDTGQGIPPKIIKAIARGGGVGLGVGIPSMQERVNQLGGRFNIESSKRGTTVTASLPLPRDTS